MKKNIYNPLKDKNYEVEIIHDKIKIPQENILLEKQSIKILQDSKNKHIYYIEFKRAKQNIVGLMSDDFQLLELIYNNVLIIVPYFGDFKYYYYFNKEYKKSFFSKFSKFSIEKIKNFNLLTEEVKKFVVVEYLNEAVFFLNILEGLMFNEDLIENKKELHEKGYF